MILALITEPNPETFEPTYSVDGEDVGKIILDF